MEIPVLSEVVSEAPITMIRKKEMVTQRVIMPTRIQELMKIQKIMIKTHITKTDPIEVAMVGVKHAEAITEAVTLEEVGAVVPMTTETIMTQNPKYNRFMSLLQLYLI